ncbi:hypothetical protein CU097_011453 [Rhizopus azygosporus]|uniref:Uncharacterized protein n=1 Tax=Rhizopus azygosporus TaxID=86630 RepID=A0A367JMK7_RHIAZ|nr:hypothetical protein CU097_011453 [Rhizopus azygosporus]
MATLFDYFAEPASYKSFDMAKFLELQGYLTKSTSAYEFRKFYCLLSSCLYLTHLYRLSISRVSDFDPLIRPQSYRKYLLSQRSLKRKQYEPAREIHGVGCYIERFLANNASISSFQINTLPRCVHSVVPLMKLHPISSSVVLIKPRYEQWLSISLSWVLLLAPSN